MNKRLAIIVGLLFLCVALMPADDVIWGSNYDVGNVILEADAAFEAGLGNLEIAGYPSVELILLEPIFEDIAPLNVGAKAYGRFGLGLLSPSIDIGIGFAGTAHLGFADMDIPEVSEYLDPLDIFVEIGLCLDIIGPSPLALGMIVNSGLNYWFAEDVAFGLKYTSWRAYSGGGVGILLKFADRNSAEKAADKAIAE